MTRTPLEDQLMQSLTAANAQVDAMEARAEAAEARVKELDRLCNIMSKFIAGDSTQRGVQAAYEFRKAINTKGTDNEDWRTTSTKTEGGYNG